MNKLVWEMIDENPTVYRARIFNGWLVRLSLDVMTPINTGYDKPEMLTGYEWRESLTFVPDPNYEWKLIEAKEK